MDSVNKSTPPASGRYRGPAGLGQQAVCAIEQSLGTGEGVKTVEEDQFLQACFPREGRLIPEGDWQVLPLIANQTAENEIRYREADQRAVKRPSYCSHEASLRKPMPLVGLGTVSLEYFPV